MSSESVTSIEENSLQSFHIWIIQTKWVLCACKYLIKQSYGKRSSLSVPAAVLLDSLAEPGLDGGEHAGWLQPGLGGLQGVGIPMLYTYLEGVSANIGQKFPAKTTNCAQKSLTPHFSLPWSLRNKVQIDFDNLVF